MNKIDTDIIYNSMRAAWNSADLSQLEQLAKDQEKSLEITRIRMTAIQDIILEKKG